MHSHLPRNASHNAQIPRGLQAGFILFLGLFLSACAGGDWPRLSDPLPGQITTKAEDENDTARKPALSRLRGQPPAYQKAGAAIPEADIEFYVKALQEAVPMLETACVDYPAGGADSALLSCFIQMARAEQALIQLRDTDRGQARPSEQELAAAAKAIKAVKERYTKACQQQGAAC